MLLLLTLLITTVLILGLCFLPLRMQIDVQAADTLSWRIVPSILWLKKVFRFRLIRTQRHHEVLYLPQHGSPHCISSEKLQNPSGKRLALSLWNVKPIRRYLLRHIHHFCLVTEIIVHAEDAARTAMITGFFHVISNMIHSFTDNVSTRIIPGFSHQHTVAHTQCIFSVKLGTLLITSVMVLLHSLKRQSQTTGR